MNIRMFSYYFSILSNEAREAVLAAGGTISKKQCCDRDGCGCQRYADRAYDALEDVPARKLVTLYGLGNISGKRAEGEPLGFSYIPLYRLTTGVWIKFVSRREERFSRAEVCDPEAEVQAWLQRIQEYQNAGGFVSPYTMIEFGLSAECPTVATVAAEQQKLEEKRREEMQELRRERDHERPAYV